MDIAEKSLLASLVIATLPPPSVAIVSSTGQFDTPRIQIMEPTLEHYLSPDKMTFSPFWATYAKIVKT